MFDLDWNLVAIHNLGDPAFDKLAPEFNQGIPADAIRKRIVNPAREGAAEREEAISASLARA